MILIPDLTGAATNKTKVSKSILTGLLLLLISFALSIFLFATVLDKLLLWQFEGAFLNAALRILLTLFIFQILLGYIEEGLNKTNCMDYRSVLLHYASVCGHG